MAVYTMMLGSSAAAGVASPGQVLFTGNGYRSDGGSAGTLSSSGARYYTYSWLCPPGVTSVCAVVIGGGGVGNPGVLRASGDSYFIGDSSSTVSASGGSSGALTIVGDGGGLGGQIGPLSSPGGGGAGGYSGNGGTGMTYNASISPIVPTGGGGGGGGGKNTSTYRGAGGGGVGVLGAGSSGSRGTGSASGGVGGGGGSGGTAGGDATTSSQGAGGTYGGGGGGNNAAGGWAGCLAWKNNIPVTPGVTYTVQAGGGGTTSPTYLAGEGGPGAVRIIWGSGRAFPSTNTGDV